MQYTLVGNEDGTANLTVFVEGGAPVSAHSSHPNYDAIFAGVLQGDETVLGLFDIAASAGAKFERLGDRVTALNGRLYLDGEEIDNSLSEQVIRFLNEGVEDWKPLVAFFENVQDNPSYNSRKELYGWLAAEAFTITEDGMIVGYKGVNGDGDGGYQSVHSGAATVNGVKVEGNVPNPIGAVIEMPRYQVDDNTGVDCSHGLHVGTYAYASGFGNILLEVEVHPRDVVSVPNHDTNKMRVCRYKVIDVIEVKYDDAVKWGDVAIDEFMDEDYEDGEFLDWENADDIIDVEEISPEVVEEPKQSLKDKALGRSNHIVAVGDVFADRDKRRKGNTFTVESLNDGVATGTVLPSGNHRYIKVKRLLSRKYQLVTS